MRAGASISGALHLGLIGFAIWGMDVFADADVRPMAVGTVSLIDGADFDAQLSAAPVVPTNEPGALGQPAEDSADAPGAESAEDPPAAAAEPAPLTVSDPPEPRPDRPEIAIPPPPTDVPTEAPVPSIAEIPSPDPLEQQAATPESPPATEPLQPLASATPPTPEPRPARPPDPEPEPEPEPEVVETPDEAVAEETPPEPAPEAAPEPEPEPELEVAEAAPEAPESFAPQSARLPVARPADLAAAAPAASAASTPEQTPAAEPKPDAEPETRPSRPAAGSASRFAQQVTRGEKSALRDGIRRYFTYNGNRSDRSLAVVIAIEVDRAGKIVGKPTLIDSAGGPAAARNALFSAGRRALLRAANAGEFARLPSAKYEAWRVIHVTFTPDDLGFQA